MTDKVVLGYWNIRGLAERIRLLLEFVGLPYEQQIFTPDNANDWFEKIKVQYKQKNSAVNLPFLNDNGKIICQSYAILVYICHKANRADLLGESMEDQVTVATLNGVLCDLNKGYLGFVYGEKKYEQFKEEAYTSLKAHWVKFNGLLGEKDFYGEKLTFMDIVLSEVEQLFSLFHEKFAEDFPKLKAHQERVWGLDGISDYLKSDRFKERPINWYPHAKWF